MISGAVLARREGWIAVYSSGTWQICASQAYGLAAFPLLRKKAAFSIREGDLIFPYVTGHMVFTGLLMATKEIEIDMESRMFGPPGRFPVILKVQPLKILDADSAIPLSDAGSRLAIMRGISKKNWPYALRTSPRRISKIDSEVISSFIGAL